MDLADDPMLVAAGRVKLGDRCELKSVTPSLGPDFWLKDADAMQLLGGAQKKRPANLNKVPGASWKVGDATRQEAVARVKLGGAGYELSVIGHFLAASRRSGLALEVRRVSGDVKWLTGRASSLTLE